MAKIVVNKCHGGFGLSEAGLLDYARRKGLTLYPEKDQTFMSLTTYWTVPPDARPAVLDGEAFYAATMEQRKASNEAYRAAHLYDRDIPRDDPDLVATVETLGFEAASDRFAKLAIVEIPDDVQWQIEEYDGLEWIAEAHRTW